MKLLFLIGNAAVGKMTVGQDLMKLTGLRLFHNHMTIESVLEIFGDFNGKAIQRLRDDDAAHRIESLDGEIPFENYLRIDNSCLPPEEAARRIQEHFHL